MEKDILISVITICYNAERDISATMESVMKQEFLSFEYVIKDGISKDHTNDRILSICEKYKNSGVDVKHVINSDAGIYDAMNQAVENCVGEWIVFINAGDAFCDTQVLSKAADILTGSRSDVIFGNAIVFDEAGQGVWIGNINTIKKHMPFCHQACFVRRKLLQEYPFDLQYKIGADYNCIATLYENNKKFEKIDLNIAKFGLDGVSSTKYIAKAKEQQKIRYAHKFIKHYYSFDYAGRLAEAGVKTCLDKLLPNSFKCKLKNFYKTYVKHYASLPQ